MELQREREQLSQRLTAITCHNQGLNLGLENKKPAIWGNQSRKNGRTGLTMGLWKSCSTITLLPPLTPAGCPGRIFLKFQKLLHEIKRPLHAIPQVARSSQAGAYLPRGLPLHNFHLKRSLGPWWPTLLRPINGLSSGVHSEGALPAGRERGWGNEG